MSEYQNEGISKKKIIRSFTMDRKVFNSLKEISEVERRSCSSMLELIILEYIEKHSK